MVKFKERWDQIKHTRDRGFHRYYGPLYSVVSGWNTFYVVIDRNRLTDYLENEAMGTIGQVFVTKAEGLHSAHQYPSIMED